MTELECMTDYSLVPVDSQLTGGVSSDTWNINWSSLFINGVQHLWSDTINIVIPAEISWDYTWNDEEFNLDIEWYNIDADYIQSVIDNQNYIPTKDDFYNVFTNFSSFGGLLIVCLFVILVFYMIKKIFS